MCININLVHRLKIQTTTKGHYSMSSENLKTAARVPVRPHIINVRFSDEEKIQLVAAANKYRTNASTFIRYVTMQAVEKMIAENVQPS